MLPWALILLLLLIHVALNTGEINWGLQWKSQFWPVFANSYLLPTILCLLSSTHTARSEINALSRRHGHSSFLFSHEAKRSGGFVPDTEYNIEINNSVTFSFITISRNKQSAAFSDYHLFLFNDLWMLQSSTNDRISDDPLGTVPTS